MTNHSNQAVLITGCSSGIGRALADEFKNRGYRVFASARRDESLDELKQAGHTAVSLDVTKSASIKAAVAEVLADAGRIDYLINNAGFGLVAPTIELSDEDLRGQLETNVVGPLALARAVVPNMVARGSGRIVNLGSVSGILATPFAGAYCASKAALHLLSDTLRMELAPFGIDVILIQPGAIESNFGNAAETYARRFGHEGSLYQPIVDFLIKRAQSSQKDATDTATFAKTLIDAVTATKAPAVLRLGSGAQKYVAMQRLIPTATLDKIPSGMFGLDKLKK
jgi:NAD(P)-dependent dehydrogenase (short-subunit alcohol dehydrogenase family)